MENKKRISISLSNTVLEKLEKMAKAKGLNKSSMITFLIEGDAEKKK